MNRYKAILLGIVILSLFISLAALLLKRDIVINLDYTVAKRSAPANIGRDFANYIEGKDKILLREGKNVIRVPLEQLELSEQFFVQNRDISVSGELYLPSNVERVFFSTASDYEEKHLLFDRYLESQTAVSEQDGYTLYSVKDSGGITVSDILNRNQIASNSKSVVVDIKEVNVDEEQLELSVKPIQDVVHNSAYRAQVDLNIFYTPESSNKRVLFTFDDLNSEEGRDLVLVKIFNPQGDLVRNEIINDNGFPEGSRQINKDNLYSFEVPVTESGIYAIKLSGTGDILFRDFEFTTNYYDLGKNLFFANASLYRQEEKPVTIYTTCEQVRLEVAQSGVIVPVTVTRLSNSGTEVERYTESITFESSLLVNSSENSVTKIDSPVSNFRATCFGGNQAKIYSSDQFITNKAYLFYDIKDVSDLRAYDFVLTTYKKLENSNGDRFGFSVDTSNLQVEGGGLYIEFTLVNLDNQEVFAVLDGLKITIDQ